MRFDLVQERDAIIQTFARVLASCARPLDPIMFGTPAAAHWSMSSCAMGSNLAWFSTLLKPFGNRAAARDHGRQQAVFLQHRPILWADEVDAVNAEPGRVLAAVFQRPCSGRRRCYKPPASTCPCGTQVWFPAQTRMRTASAGRKSRRVIAYIVSAMGFALWIDTKARSHGRKALTSTGQWALP